MLTARLESAIEAAKSRAMGMMRSRYWALLRVGAAMSLIPSRHVTWARVAGVAVAAAAGEIKHTETGAG